MEVPRRRRGCEAWAGPVHTHSLKRAGSLAASERLFGLFPERSAELNPGDHGPPLEALFFQWHLQHNLFMCFVPLGILSQPLPQEFCLDKWYVLGLNPLFTVYTPSSEDVTFTCRLCFDEHRIDFSCLHLSPKLQESVAHCLRGTPTWQLLRALGLSVTKTEVTRLSSILAHPPTSTSPQPRARVQTETTTQCCGVS